MPKMSEKYDKDLVDSIKQDQAACSRTIASIRHNISINEIGMRNMKKRIEKERELLELRIKDWEMQIHDHALNTDMLHVELEKQVTLKEDLHAKLKDALHVNEIACQFCGRFYSQKGIKRHEQACSARPNQIEADESEEDLKKTKADASALKKKRAELEKALKALEEGE